MEVAGPLGTPLGLAQRMYERSLLFKNAEFSVDTNFSLLIVKQVMS